MTPSEPSRLEVPPMRLMQLIYISKPFGFSSQILADLLEVAQDRNQRDGITGALVCRSDLYMQMLEGPRTRVTSCFQRILADDRHTQVTLVWAGDTLARQFDRWTMRDDRVRSWMWSPAEVRKGAPWSAGIGVFRAWFDRLSAEEPRPALAR